jgi:CHASE3 domain sensor protein
MALAILVFIGVLSYRSVLRSREDVWWVTHTHQVLEQIARVTAAMTDAETGQRGFVVTGDESYLQPYNDAFARVRKDESDLRELTSDNPIQQRNLDRLEPLITAKFAELQVPIELRRRNGFDAARQAISKGTGKLAMDQIRTLLGSMTEEENRLLVLRTNESEASTRWTKRVILAGNTAAFFSYFSPAC